MPIPWYYTWSNRFFHEVLQHSMKDSAFCLIPKKIVGLEDSTDYYNEIVSFLENSDSPYIIFSDAEFIVKSDIFKNMQSHIENNEAMVFLKENSLISPTFMLLKVCPEVIDFFKKINNTTNINELLKKEFKGKWTVFDDQLFTCSNLWNMDVQFSIMKPQTSNLGKEMDFAEKIFIMAQHLNLDQYMEYVPENIIPFIYKFQELVYLSHQESRTAGIL